MSKPKKINSPSRSLGLRVPAGDWNEFEKFKKLRNQKFKLATTKPMGNTEAFLFVFRIGLQTALQQLGDRYQPLQ